MVTMVRADHMAPGPPAAAAVYSSSWLEFCSCVAAACACSDNSIASSVDFSCKGAINASSLRCHYHGRRLDWAGSDGHWTGATLSNLSLSRCGGEGSMGLV